jgi:creatinine amidohydrolase
MYLANLTTHEFEAWCKRTPCVVLVPTGSCEPHGPHLPLDTDTRISVGAIERAVAALRAAGVPALVAPSVGYGVTDFAVGFAGAISIPSAVLTEFLRSIVSGFLSCGVSHVCLVNNHLEPAQDAAVRAAIAGNLHASVACPLTRRWARTLSAEFKSGACHAGQYETSLALAHEAAAVRAEYTQLTALDVSLSAGIAAGKNSFAALGMAQAYCGAPAAASAIEGEALFEKLATMVVTEVLEGLAAAAIAG